MILQEKPGPFEKTQSPIKALQACKSFGMTIEIWPDLIKKILPNADSMTARAIPFWSTNRDP